MELTELSAKVMELLEIEDLSDLSSTLMKVASEDKQEIYRGFVDLVEDLSVDWLQRIYQYWLADRENKKQDYTPKSIASLLAKTISPETTTVVDMCAGSGALTIQAWNQRKDVTFECIEFDENVIPLLLFNLAVRNIEAQVEHKDVLEDELFNMYIVIPGEKFGKVEKIETSN